MFYAFMRLKMQTSGPILTIMGVMFWQRGGWGGGDIHKLHLLHVILKSSVLAIIILNYLFASKRLSNNYQ